MALICPFMPPDLGIELMYSFVIIICSSLIYYTTRELYELSSYGGIAYFRRSFLFFAIAYFFRYVLRFILMFLNIAPAFELSPRLAGALSFFGFIYASSMAMTYLLYSLVWKKETKIKNWMFHCFSFIITLFCIFFRDISAFFIFNAIFLVIVLAVLFKAYRNSKNRGHIKSTYLIYLCLIMSWALNISDVIIPRFFELFRILIYLISVGLFILMLYKVLKKVGG